MSDNRSKLEALLADVLMLPPGDVHLDLNREDTPTWDSLAVVSIAVGVEETFGYHMSPDEAIAIANVPQLMTLLESNGVSFAD